jgi:hypothetical protein
MKGLSRVRRRQPPPALLLDLKEIQERQQLKTPPGPLTPNRPLTLSENPLSSSTSSTSPTTIKPTTVQPTKTLLTTSRISALQSPTKTLIFTTTRLETTKIESPTATVFITATAISITVTVGPLDQLPTGQPAQGDAQAPTNEAPAKGAEFSSGTGGILLVVLSVLGMTSYLKF